MGKTLEEVINLVNDITDFKTWEKGDVEVITLNNATVILELNEEVSIKVVKGKAITIDGELDI